MMARGCLAGLVRRCLTGATVIRLAPISVVLASGVAIMTWTHHLLSEHRDLVVHTHEVIETAKDVLIGLDDAETGQRGYLLSGERHYLEPHTHTREGPGAVAATLKAQVADNAAQTERVAVLIGLASLLTRAGVESYLTWQAIKMNNGVKPDASVA